MKFTRMRLLIPMFLVVFAGAAHGQDWETAKVLGAETRGTDNVLAVQIGELAIVALYTAQWSVMGNTAEWRRASNLVIGSDVQARIDGGRLHVVMPNGKIVKADIVRRALQKSDGLVLLPEDDESAGSRVQSGQHAISESECIGAVVNGVCHGTPTPEAQIKIQTGQAPRCYGTMIGGRCTGPMF
jgi:hypothetical protein